MGYERSGAWTVHHGIRVLATGCAQHRRPVPAVGAVVLGPQSVTLLLTTPDETAPPGWTVADQGRTWLSSRYWLGAAVVDDGIPDPYPLLVSAGTIGKGRLLLNLGQADGLISVEGDLDVARSLVRSWSRRLTTGPWAGARVIRVGFPPDPDFTGWNVSRLAEAAPALADPEGGILFLAERPADRDRHEIDRLRSDPAPRWSAVAVGADHAVWRFVVDGDGTLDTGLLAEPVRLRP